MHSVTPKSMFHSACYSTHKHTVFDIICLNAMCDSLLNYCSIAVLLTSILSNKVQYMLLMSSL